MVQWLGSVPIISSPPWLVLNIDVFHCYCFFMVNHSPHFLKMLQKGDFCHPRQGFRSPFFLPKAGVGRGVDSFPEANRNYMNLSRSHSHFNFNDSSPRQRPESRPVGKMFLPDFSSISRFYAKKKRPISRMRSRVHGKPTRLFGMVKFIHPYFPELRMPGAVHFDEIKPVAKTGSTDCFSAVLKSGDNHPGRFPAQIVPAIPASRVPGLPPASRQSPAAVLRFPDFPLSRSG